MKKTLGFPDMHKNSTPERKLALILLYYLVEPNMRIKNMYELVEIHAGHKTVIDVANTRKKAEILLHIYQLVADRTTRILIK